MPKLPGISHNQAVRVFGKIGFHIAREGKHTIMSNGKVRLTIPRHNPINAFTMAGIARDAGLTRTSFAVCFDSIVTMELEFTLEKADLLAYAAYAKKAMSLIIRPRLRSLSLMWAVVCMVILLSGFLIDRDNALLTLGILLAIVCSLLGYSKLFLKRYFENYYTPEFFPDSFVPQKILLDPKMLVNVRQNSRAEFLWSAINEVVHTQAHTFILLPNKTGFIVPHRIFRNSTEIQGFKDRLGAMWNSGHASAPAKLAAH